MRKFLKAILFLCALSSLAYADEAAPVVAEANTTMSAEEQKDAMDILDRMRARIEKEEEEKAKLAAEARELGISTSEVASMDNVEEMLEAKRIYIEDMYSYDGSQAVHIPKNMSPEELTKEYWALYEKVFEIGNIMRRTVLRKEFFKAPGRYLFYMAINLYYRYQIKNRLTPNII